MLLRIAPEMFIDDKYECVTVREVHNEIIQTKKFKDKYPWTRYLRGKIKTFSVKSKSKLIEAYFSAITLLNEEGTINTQTERLFDLSFVDRKIISYTLAFKHKVTSGDQDLVDFCKQEFPKEFKGAVTPLEIINRWIEKGIIKWDDDKQKYLSDWCNNREKPQPEKAKKKFKKLTGRKYTGS